MVLHSLALRDVVTLWVKSVFILDCSEGLAVFAGVSSSVNCHLSVSLAEWTLVMFFLCSMFHHPSVGCVTCRMFFPSSFTPLAFFLRVQFPVGSVQPLVAVPWGEPICIYNHIAVQFPADSDVYFYDGVDMCGLLKVLFPTILFTLSAWQL